MGTKNQLSTDAVRVDKSPYLAQETLGEEKSQPEICMKRDRSREDAHSHQRVGSKCYLYGYDGRRCNFPSILALILSLDLISSPGRLFLIGWSAIRVYVHQGV